MQQVIGNDASIEFTIKSFLPSRFSLVHAGKIQESALVNT